MSENNQYNLISEVYDDPKYAGKHVIVIGGRVYATKTGEAKSKLLRQLIDQHPDERPLITYVPEEETLILHL